MVVSTSKVAIVFVAVLLACAWHMTQADPFIPTGSNPGGANDEKGLFNISSGYAWRAPSLMYIYVALPNASDPDNETLWETTEKAIFFPPVDKLSKLTIPGTYAAFAANSSQAASPIIWVNAFGMNSTRKHYFVRSSGAYTVGAFQLVVEMAKGVVNKLTWIDGCGECQCSSSGSATCQSNVCVTNNCAISENDCTALAADQCNMKFYVAWVGSDVNNRPCTSAGSLPYNFVQFGLSAAYRAAAGVDKQYLFNLKFLTGAASSMTAPGPCVLALIVLIALALVF